MKRNNCPGTLLIMLKKEIQETIFGEMIKMRILNL